MSNSFHAGSPAFLSCTTPGRAKPVFMLPVLSHGAALLHVYTEQLNTTLAAPAAKDKYGLNANTNNCREQRQVKEKRTQFILADLMLL